MLECLPALLTRMDGRTVLTTREASFAALEAQVREIKAQLDACLAEAKACLPA